MKTRTLGKSDLEVSATATIQVEGARYPEELEKRTGL
jgi:hypothetical protein